PGSARNLLYAKKQGFKTATLDISKTNNQYYASICGFDQVYNSFDEIEDSSIDLIFMTHVIEHVPEPTEMVHQTHRILKPGGLILVSTPSTSSLFKRLLKYKWWIYDIDDHVSFFNLSNLKRLFTRSSFQIIASRSNH